MLLAVCMLVGMTAILPGMQAWAESGVEQEESNGQAYVSMSGTFDEETGKFNYTITVDAQGDVTNVNVNDVISGNALVFNNDVQVTGNSSSYRDNWSPNGFDYTFASMRDGEQITITYSASVDFSKDYDEDGKISDDQTKNTVTVRPDGGDPHSSGYSQEIVFKTTRKSNGTPCGTTEDGDRIYTWTITYNELMLASAGGDTIQDTIAADSTEYMKYYGDELSIDVIGRNGNTVDTRSVPYSSLNSYSGTSWIYKIPDSDSQPYMYEITYYTVVDMKKVDGTGGTVTVSNDANGSRGSALVTPGDAISVEQSVESFTTEEVNWTVTLGVPEGGLTQAVMTDYLPGIWLDGRHYDHFKDGSLEITGLENRESYSLDTSAQGKVTITFFRDKMQTKGLLGTPGGRTITVKLTTLVDQEWLQAGYEAGGYVNSQTNIVDFNRKTVQASVKFINQGIEKKGEALADSEGNVTGLKYTLVLKGISETPVSVVDTFDTNILEVDTSKVSSWDHMRIWGGNEWSQDAGRMPVSCTDTSYGIILTAAPVPMQADGSYYPYYKITYYLKLKDGVDLSALATANGGEYDVVNTVNWGDFESEFSYKVEGSREIILSDEQKPTAKTDLVYKGAEQELVNAPAEELPKGAAEMRYALGTNDATVPADNLYITSIPTAADAGTYYVWYKAAGDEDHQDSEPACIVVNIRKADLDLSVSISDWEAGTEAPAPVLAGNSGNGKETYTYAVRDSEEFTNTVPTAAGEYTLKASVAETANYEAAEATCDF